MVPPKIYKYEAFTAQTLHNLKSQALYFGSPLGFNDPYDCALKVAFEHPSDETVEAIRQFYLTDTELSPVQKSELEAVSIEELRVHFLKGAASAVQDATEDFLRNRGVTCFSECNDDLLMWSHYGGGYKGFCLEFSTEFIPFGKIWKVEYTANLPKLELAPFLIERDSDFIRKLFCTKSTAWSYEREWRAIHAEAGTKYGYPATSLTGVYFGPDIDQQSMEIVCLILAGQNESVKFWRGSRSESEFKVNFEQFTYLSYRDAKRNGLK